jgi:WD40 repeat protein
VAFSPDGTLVAAASRVPAGASTVSVWDVKTGVRKHLLPAPGSPVSGAFSPDGLLLAGAGGSFEGSNGSIVLWNVKDGRRSRVLKNDAGPIGPIGFRGRSRIVGGSPDTGRTWLVKVWDLAKEGPAQALAFTSELPPGFSGDGLRTVGMERSARAQEREVRLRVLDTLTGDERGVFRLDGFFSNPTALTLSLDGRYLAASIAVPTPRLSAFVNVWDLQTGERFAPSDRIRDRTPIVAFSPDSTRLAYAADEIVIWDAATRKEIHRLPSHMGWPTALAVSAGGKFTASSTSGEPGVRLTPLTFRIQNEPGR